MQNIFKLSILNTAKNQSKPNKSIALLFYPTFLASVICLQSCNGGNYNSQGWNAGPAEVPIATAQKGYASVSKEYAASIEGVQNVEIQSQVTGYLSKIFMDEGDYVSAGQPLFKIEDKPYLEQLHSAQAALTTAHANLANAKIELDRKKELVKNKVVSDLQVQQAETTYNAMKGAVSQAVSQVQAAKINLDFCIIKAPVSGYLSRFNYRLGSYISPANATPIALLSDIHQVNAYFSMSENDFANFQEQYGNEVKNAPAVTLITSNKKPYELPGKIDAVEGQFNKGTGAINLRAKFDNPKLQLRSGNTGKITIVQNYTDVMLIPIASTTMMQDKVFVFSVDKNNKAIQLPIEIAGKSDDKFIVSKGLKPGDRYIVSGFDRLQSGSDVVEQKANKKQAKQSQNNW